MPQIGLPVALRIAAFIAATAQAIGFVGLFAFDALQPYKWILLVSGTVAMVILQVLIANLARRMAKEPAE
jgi:bacteriorhodopsin